MNSNWHHAFDAVTTHHPEKNFSVFKPLFNQKLENEDKVSSKKVRSNED